MKAFVPIIATAALILGAITDNVASPTYGLLLTMTFISEAMAAASFIYLFGTSRGLLKYYSAVCVVLCLLILADAASRLFLLP